MSMRARYGSGFPEPRALAGTLTQVTARPPAWSAGALEHGCRSVSSGGCAAVSGDQSLKASERNSQV